MPHEAEDPSHAKSWLRVRRWWPHACAAVVFVVFYLLTFPRAQETSLAASGYALEVSLATSESGSAQLFFDRGRDFSQIDSASVHVERSDDLVPIQFALPSGLFRRLRLDYINGAAAHARIAGPRIVDIRSGAVLCNIPISRWEPNNQIASIEVVDGVLAVTPQSAADDPYLVATLDRPLEIGRPGRPGAMPAATRAFIAFFGALATGMLLEIAIGRASLNRLLINLSSWIHSSPRSALALVAAVSVTACCYPVIFAGRSFVSPQHGLALIHPDHPTPENADGTETIDIRGSDIGAMLWQHLPYSIIQHQALITEHTLPLWNRYNSCGVDLFGQGQSMLGDPLHLPVILAGGDAWAWDAKFVIARFLFAFGAGLAALAATRRLGAAALITLGAPFIGFFSYRFNHPAVITVCYSPWVIVAWLELACVSKLQAVSRWLALLVAANVCLLTSGTVKEASMLAVVLNATGLLAVLLARQEAAIKRRILCSAAALSLGGVMLAAPWWTAFLSTLGSAWTAYDTPYAVRIPISRFAGLFDGMLYSEFFAERSVYAPSANFLILLGVLLACLRARALASQRSLLAVGIVLAATLSLAFSTPWLPDAWILAIPGLRSVGHVGNTFSCAALPLLFLLAAHGFAVSGDAPRFRTRNAAVIAGLVGVLIAPILVDLIRTWGVTGTELRDLARTVGEHRFFFVSLATMPAAWGIALVSHRWAVASTAPRRGAAVVLAVAALVPLLGRHGQSTSPGHDLYFTRPGIRADLAFPSPALEWIKAHASEPFRTLGLSDHLVAGYATVHGIETPNGPDALVNRHYREVAESAGLVPPHDWHFPTETRAVAARRRVLDALNVRFYVTCPAAESPPQWLQPAHGADLTVLESPKAWPRAFFVDQAVPASTASDFLQIVEKGDGRPVATIHPDDLQPNDRLAESGTERIVVPATDYLLTSQTTDFTVVAPRPGFVVLTEAWQRATCAVTVDGQPADILRVNHAFAGLRLPRTGVHRIRFESRHPYPALALTLASLGAAAISVTLLVPRSRPASAP